MIASITELVDRLKAHGFNERINTFSEDSMLRKYFQIGSIMLCKDTYQVSIFISIRIAVHFVNLKTKKFCTITQDITSLSDVDSIVKNILKLMN